MILRNGYTTGSCCAAAAKAAALELVCGKGPEFIELILPDGTLAGWETEKITEDTADRGTETSCIGYWSVRKDSGDDPDVTNGIRICAKVSYIDEKTLETCRRSGSGYWLEEYGHLYLTGGTGIGIVTLPGLSCPIGHYAINPVPRRMILEAVSQVCPDAQNMLIELAIPAGETLAEKTFNPKLGIQNGISVLGTTGIVRPMSEEALIETIRLEIHMKAAAGEKALILTPGNYGETFLREKMGVALGEAVVCSNFAAAAAEILSQEDIKKVLFAGHIGKLIKVAAGMRNTHSRYGDMRMETLEKLTFESLQGAEFDYSQIRKANTTEEAVGFLKQFRAEDGNMTMAEAVLNLTAQKVKRQMEEWSAGKVCMDVIVFSSAHQMVGSTIREGCDR